MVSNTAFASSRITAWVAFLCIVGVLSTGCASAATDESSNDGDTSALTADQLRPANSRPLVVNIPAVDSSATGAASWSLYTANIVDSKSKRTFVGLMAYGSDSNGQAVWGLLIDSSAPTGGVAVQFTPNGEAMTKTTIPADTQKALDVELKNLRVALQSTAPSTRPLDGDKSAGVPLTPEQAASVLTAGEERPEGHDWAGIMTTVGMGLLVVLSGVWAWLLA